MGEQRAGWPDRWVGAASTVAPRLLGAVVVHAGVAVALTEVEAYQGPDDPASHAFRGPTPRATALFGPPGRLYVYLSYGMHRAVNIVTGPDGVASGVLLRAGRVVAGLDVARDRHPGVADHRLARGPGNLGRVLAMALSDSKTPIHVVDDLTEALDADDGVCRIVPPSGTFGGVGGVGRGEPAAAPARTIAAGPRVGVGAASDRAWRFFVEGDSSVSAYRRGGRRGSS